MPPLNPRYGKFFLLIAWMAFWLGQAAAVLSEPLFTADRPAPLVRAKVLGTMPHDPDHFTQGLFFSGPYLYESTGQYGRSGLFRLDPQTGSLLQARSFARYFAEGGAALRGKIHLLTWQDGVRLTLAESDMRLLAVKPLPGEGWGLCSDGENLWLSDGSSTVRRLRVAADGEWEELARLRVTDAGQPVERINELEWVNGLLFANVWQSDKIAVIDPGGVEKPEDKLPGEKSPAPKAPEAERAALSCPVLLWLDCSALVPAEHKGSLDAVLNGIAWDAGTQRLLITGKLWPLFYQLALPDELNGKFPGNGFPDNNNFAAGSRDVAE